VKLLYASFPPSFSSLLNTLSKGGFALSPNMCTTW
jgi:hypothetical protein